MALSLMKITRKLVLTLAALLMCTLALRGQWTYAAGPAHGEISAIIFHQGVLIVGTTKGAILRSTDMGMDWDYVYSPKYPFSEVTSFAATKGALFATKVDLLRSTDGGINWSKATTPSDQCGHYQVVQVEQTVYVRGCERGFSSTDDGETWEAVTRRSKPGSRFTFHDGNFCMMRDNKIFTSRGADVEWDSAYLPQGSMNHRFLTSTGDALFISGLDTDVRRLKVGSTTWETISNNVGDEPELSKYKFFTAFGDGILGVHKIHPTLAGEFRSTDLGDTWHRLTSTTGSSRQVTASLPEISFRADSWHIWSSVDKGLSWKQENQEFNGTHIEGLTGEGRILFAGDNRLFKSTDAGVSWTRVPIHPDFADSLVSLSGMSLHNGVLYVHGVNTSEWWCSTDYGDTWRDISPMRRAGQDCVFSGDTVFIPMYNAVYRSTDTGATWNSIVVADSLKRRTESRATIFAFEVMDGYYYAGTGFDLFRSPDKGQTWEALDTEGLHWNSLVKLVNGSGTLFMLNGYGAVYKSTDAGTSWSWYHGGSQFILDIEVYNDIVFLRDDQQIWQASSRDSSLTLVSGDIRGGSVNIMRVIDSSLYVGVPAVGVAWRSIDNRQPTHVFGEVASKQNVSAPTITCSPNPIVNEACIDLSLPELSFTTLTLFSITGEQVGVLYSGLLDAGHHTIRWRDGGLQSGVYYLQLICNVGRATEVVRHIR